MDKSGFIPVFSRYARLLHWGVACILLVGLLGVELHELFPRGTELRAAFKSIHFQAGLLVFVLVWLRMVRAAFGSTPPVFPPLPLFQQLLAKGIHFILYLGMIVLPILGVLDLQAADKPLTFFGLPLPVLVAPDKALARELVEWHENIGNLLILMIVLHAASALWHHVFLHDNTLRRMLPRQ